MIVDAVAFSVYNIILLWSRVWLYNFINDIFLKFYLYTYTSKSNIDNLREGKVVSVAVSKGNSYIKLNNLSS